MITAKKNIEDILDECGFYLACVYGNSMYPLLKSRLDTVYIVKTQDKLKKYDVVLFRRKGNNQLVLHRIIKIKDGKYYIRGDFDFLTEVVDENQIIGIMTEFTHNGKPQNVNLLIYRIYYKIWNFFCPLRKFAMSLYKLTKNTQRGII